MNQKVINQFVKEFIRNPHMRTYKPDNYLVNQKIYLLDFDLDEENHCLTCTTWGYDYSTLPIPQTWDELIHYQMKAQLGIFDTNLPNKIVHNFYYEMHKRLENDATGIAIK